MSSAQSRDETLVSDIWISTFMSDDAEVCVDNDMSGSAYGVSDWTPMWKVGGRLGVAGGGFSVST